MFPTIFLGKWVSIGGTYISVKVTQILGVSSCVFKPAEIFMHGLANLSRLSDYLILWIFFQLCWQFTDPFPIQTTVAFAVHQLRWYRNSALAFHFFDWFLKSKQISLAAEINTYSINPHDNAMHQTLIDAPVYSNCWLRGMKCSRNKQKIKRP